MEPLGILKDTVFMECLVEKGAQTSWATAHALRSAHRLVSAGWMSSLWPSFQKGPCQPPVRPGLTAGWGSRWPRSRADPQACPGMLWAPPPALSSPNSHGFRVLVSFVQLVCSSSVNVLVFGNFSPHLFKMIARYLPQTRNPWSQDCVIVSTL